MSGSSRLTDSSKTRQSIRFVTIASRYPNTVWKKEGVCALLINRKRTKQEQVQLEMRGGKCRATGRMHSSHFMSKEAHSRDRGKTTAYVVTERMPLSDKGWRLPSPNSFQPWASAILIEIRVALSPSSNPSMNTKPNTQRQINLHNQPSSDQGSQFSRLLLSF